MKELHPMDQSKSMEQGSSQPHQRPTSTQQPKRGFWPIIHQCRAAHAEEKEKTQLGEQEKKKKKKPSLEKRSHAQQFKRKKKRTEQEELDWENQRRQRKKKSAGMGKKKKGTQPLGENSAHPNRERRSWIIRSL
ncbi:hypothetical protein Droror1_Dr00003648 [Drosera rotundifolia]